MEAGRAQHMVGDVMPMLDPNNTPDNASPWADEVYTDTGVEYIVLYPVNEKETSDETEE